MRGCVDLDLIDDWDKVIDSMDLPKKNNIIEIKYIVK